MKNKFWALQGIFPREGESFTFTCIFSRNFAGCLTYVVQHVLELKKTIHSDPIYVNLPDQDCARDIQERKRIKGKQKDGERVWK